MKRGNQPKGPSGAKGGIGNTELLERTMTEPLTSENISTKLERIAKLAKESPNRSFRSLAHYIDLAWLREAYRRTRKSGAVGVDGQSAKKYEANLEENLQQLLHRAKSGTYHAPPVRRVHIPKGHGAEPRALGIPTFEDKVLQRAVAMVLEALYEQDFLDCSYGFRPGRSAHQALAALQHQAVRQAGGWVLEIDVQKFFDTLDHQYLMSILRQRVQDGVLLRLIGKWLNAGVLEHGKLTYPDSGTPQGGVISPVLANIFLHEVLDVWFENVVKPRMSRPTHLFRYADDAVLLFSCIDDATRVLNVLPKRFGKYGLSLHPTKTRLVAFRRPWQGATPSAKPGTFTFLGFMHHWSKTLRGKWTVRQRTASDRFRRALQRVALYCKLHRHDSISSQHNALKRKLRGHYEYYGITGNLDALARFLHQVKMVWRKWLACRSHAAMTWERMHRLLKRYSLPGPRITHPARWSVANP